MCVYRLFCALVVLCLLAQGLVSLSWVSNFTDLRLDLFTNGLLDFSRLGLYFDLKSVVSRGLGTWRF